jgi:hypothetical protein
MRKIPTLFKRDWESKTRHIVPEVNPGCEWVLAGEGVATRKYDGSCTRIENGRFYKRREIKAGKTAPPNFEAAGPVDETTGKLMGWVPIGDGPEDKYFREAYANSDGDNLPDGTYEAVGPKFQGNNEGSAIHRLISHDRAEVLEGAPRDYAGLVAYLRNIDFEGIVFHRYPERTTQENEMVKIKKRDLPPL